MLSFPASFRMSCRFLLPVLCLCGLSAGCGSQKYESRLRETAQYFEYLDQLNANLSGSWNRSGIQYRPPQPFTELPPPKVEKDEQGKPIPTVDERQPAFIPGGLPGLVGAWQTELSVSGGDSPAPAWIYILSNHPLWLEQGQSEQEKKKITEDALGFHDLAIAQIAEGLRQRIPLTEQPGDRYQWRKGERIPRQPGYVETKRFDVLSPAVEQEIDGTPYEISLYLHQPQKLGEGGQVQRSDMRAVVMFVIPKGAQVERKSLQHVGTNDRLLLSLETLDVSPDPPRRGGGTATPSSSSPEF